ncbi:DNA alkylation repair protein [Amycolatopsis minnesotensis]|uniref:DNA alkylation repair protein n=1 Tax=Amycolatopsis minnesotensis TaxID=337894 RepID=A0ABP5BSR3_9PSEU
MTGSTSLIADVKAGLAELADPVKAPEMRRYMKSEMPFRGVPKPARSAFAKRLFAANPLTDRGIFTETVRALWRRAEFREERYLAIDLSGHRTYRHWQDAELLGLYREMIVTGAWWDYVDEIAIRRVGPILRAERATVTPVLLDWAAGEDLWLRRTAVICQVGAKGETDTDLLTAAVEATLGDKDFFLRKGIGWALRDYARTAPDWVRDFVSAHRGPAGLSPLSVREAMKHLT